MSVPAWSRKMAKTQFLYETFKFNVRIGQIVMSKPKKYRENYGDKLISYSLDALRYCQAANNIFMSETTTDENYEMRRKYLTAALSSIDSVSTVADLFLALNYNLDGAKKEQIERQEEYIGSTCRQIHLLIQGVLKSDKKTYDAKNKK